MLYKKQKLNCKLIKTRLFVIAIVAILVAGTAYTGYVRADQYDQQIQGLRAQNSQNQSNANQLADEAQSYQDAINRLQAQIDALQQAIDANEQKSDQIQQQINQAEAELAQQKKILGENIKTMYLESDVSTLEILASSKDLSDFVDKQEYRNAVTTKIKSSVDRINVLKEQLTTEQNQLKGLIKDQQYQNDQLGTTRAQQSQLLAYTEDQKATYEQQIKANNSQIAGLIAQQLAANRSLGGRVNAGDPSHGGYPAYLDRAPRDTLLDPWGMFNRECVSYTAWKVQQAYGYMPYWGGVGNANQWPADARSYGIPTGPTPKVGSVAIWNTGYYGHAMWVEAVNGNMIYVSQYNFNWDGQYSEMWVNGSNFTYLYFGSK